MTVNPNGFVLKRIIFHACCPPFLSMSLAVERQAGNYRKAFLGNRLFNSTGDQRNATHVSFSQRLRSKCWLTHSALCTHHSPYYCEPNGPFTVSQEPKKSSVEETHTLETQSTNNDESIFTTVTNCHKKALTPTPPPALPLTLTSAKPSQPPPPRRRAPTPPPQRHTAHIQIRTFKCQRHFPAK